MWVAISVLSLYSIIATYFCIKFAITVLKIQDALQDSMDTIDERYRNMSDILTRPLFFDSPEVRQVLQDIEETKECLHEIAYSMSAKLIDEEESG